MSRCREFRLTAVNVAGPSLDVSQGGRSKIRGYAAVFNKKSDVLTGGFKEILVPGCFKRCLKRGEDIRAFVDHEPRLILARWKAGTLRIDEDGKGLYVEIDPPDTTYARDVMESIRRGDVHGMSFGFCTVEDMWRREDGVNIREVIEADVFEVSIVTLPAYPDTSVSVRAS
jgi:HK97 family phage prohead protease